MDPVLRNHPEFKYQNTTLKEQREPDITGEGGSVWRLNLAPPDASQPPETHSTVGLWLLHAPEAHPMWEYYVVVLIHLRDIEGVAPAQRDTPLMEYQITVLTLDPRFALPVMVELEQGGNTARKMMPLHPADFQAQFQRVGGDHVAYEVADAMCEAVAFGKLSPDRDYRSQWAMRLAAKVMVVTTENKKRTVQ